MALTAYEVHDLLLDTAPALDQLQTAAPGVDGNSIDRAAAALNLPVAEPGVDGNSVDRALACGATVPREFVLRALL